MVGYGLWRIDIVHILESWLQKDSESNKEEKKSSLFKLISM